MGMLQIGALSLVGRLVEAGIGIVHSCPLNTILATILIAVGLCLQGMYIYLPMLYLHLCCPHHFTDDIARKNILTLFVTCNQ